MQHAAYCLLQAQAAPLMLPTEWRESYGPQWQCSAVLLAQMFPRCLSLLQRIARCKGCA